LFSRKQKLITETVQKSAAQSSRDTEGESGDMTRQYVSNINKDLTKMLIDYLSVGTSETFVGYGRRWGAH
jgi:hypothetical protein